MNFKLLFLSILLMISMAATAQVVTTVSSESVCSGAATIQVPVRVASFTAVGSISLRLSYVSTELSAPTIVYKDPGLTAWGNFSSNTTTPGTIIISAYDPDVTPAVTGLTLANNTILFTLEFTIGTITSPAVISFVENAQGTWCEYGGTGPNYTPFTDTPFENYYLSGTVTMAADPAAPGLTKVPAVAAVCAGQTLTVNTTPGTGGAGTISDEYRYSTDNGGNWSAWSSSVPSFTAVVGTSLIESRRTATGGGCDASNVNQVSWTVAADPVAPAITKVPADATVCEGQTLTVNVTPGTGGAGTIADEYRYSTDNGGTWTTWGTSVPSFAAVTGNNRIQSRRTATGTGCDASGINEVTWDVAAGPVAPGLTKNPDVAAVCAGETLTVSTTPGSGGTGTTTDQYRYSTDNGNNWTTWSASVPSFASVAGTTLIQSRRTATGTGCTESSYNEVSWTVNARQKISGIFNYHHVSGNILLNGADITVNLYKSSDLTHSTPIASDVTDATGYYEFPNICPDCAYDIVATSTHTTEGAINTTDAAQANYWGPNPVEIQKVRFHAGDVAGPNLFIGGTDAGRIQNHFVNGTGFDKAPWTFWIAGATILHNPLVNEPEYTEYYPSVMLNVGSDAVANMLGLVSGDFNRSFNPTLTKSASETLSLFQAGNLQVRAGEEFDLHVRLAEGAEVGAISLILNYPAALAEVLDVTLSEATGQLKWSVAGAGELRIGWFGPEPIHLESEEALLILRMKATESFTEGSIITVNLAPNPLNELADGSYTVIPNALLTAEVAGPALGIGDAISAKDVRFFCYPNPAGDFTLIQYNLPFAGRVTVQVSSLTGRQAALLVDEDQSPGAYLVRFDTEGLPPGVYLATLRVASDDREWVKTIKLIVNR